MARAAFDSPALRALRENAVADYAPAAKAWKEAGGKIVGLLYNDVPEELFTAAGVLPYRLRATGSTSTALAEARFTEINCSLVRHFYDAAKRGTFSFLDGLVSSNSCDHERRLFDNWVATIETPFSCFVPYPKKVGPEQVERFAAELQRLRGDLETAFGTPITHADLDAAIVLHNETRALQRRVYEVMKRADTPLDGSDVLAIMLASTVMPKVEYNRVLAALLADCDAAHGDPDPRTRVVMYGGEIDSIELLEVIEGQGALIAGDSLGYGSRMCAVDISPTGDPMTDIARWAVAERPQEPRVFGTAESRQAYVADVMKDAGASGVILTHLPMCDFWGFEKHNFDAYAETHEIPVLSLNVDYIVANTGQMATRVQAFVETLATMGGR